MDNGEITGLISIDIRKAFDSIDHKILLRKMQDQFGVQDFELKWFQSYLTKRSQVCVVGGHTSLAKEIVCGVPQGSILEPLMFLLYINDLPECLKNTTPGMYVDDTQIYASSASFSELVTKLNQDLENIMQNKLQLHTKKTKAMFIGSPYNLKNKVEMSDNWFENMDNGEITGLISVDIRKAFDSIDHKILLRKMQDQFGVQDFELKWFQSYLTKRSQVCVVDGHTSLAKEIVCGVPQGSILGLLMFLLYINDLPECLKNTTPG
ncbi:Hypothetical predicted protein, partial [Paramuricea clavata]